MEGFKPEEKPRRELHHILLSCIAPRPIAFVSTLGTDNTPNLAPFSFFNCFSSNPPVVVFSPSYRGTDGSAKDTLQNLRSLPECTINGVPEYLLPQVNLAASPYPPDVDEFQQTGLTPVPSAIVAPFRVKEAPFTLECKVRQIIELSPGQPASGNLVICDVVYIHLSPAILDEQGKIDPRKLQLVGRLGYSWYSRTADSLFCLDMPLKPTIGIPQLPVSVQHSPIFTIRELALLASVPSIPEPDPSFVQHLPSAEPPVETAFLAGNTLGALRLLLEQQEHLTPEEFQLWIHRIAREVLQQYQIETAWQILLCDPYL